MPYIVSIFLVESVVCNELERLTPEDEAVLQRQSNAFEEERILQTAKVFQVTVLSESQM